jgi:hypothetical protein
MVDTSGTAIETDPQMRPQLLASSIQAPSSCPANFLRGVQRLGHTERTVIRTMGIVLRPKKVTMFGKVLNRSLARPA